MSFIKYIENKTKSNIIIAMDEYKEKLYADMASLVIKPDEKITEALKNIVDTKELSMNLSELSYPFSNELEMAMRTGDPKRVNYAHSKFRKWSNCTNADHVFSDKIENTIFKYQSKLYSKEFGPTESDEVVKSSLAESTAILDQMSHSINLSISKMTNWNNHQILIEAISPKTGWIISEAKVTIGDSFQASFLYEKTPMGFKVKSLQEKEELPTSLKEDINDLLTKLKNNPKYNNILTLYMTRPISERKYFEIIKRDLSLGIKIILPKHITLKTIPFSGEENDVWKVRIEEKYIKESNKESNKEYQLIAEETPIRWIERLKT